MFDTLAIDDIHSLEAVASDLLWRLYVACAFSMWQLVTDLSLSCCASCAHSQHSNSRHQLLHLHLGALLYACPPCHFLTSHRLVHFSGLLPFLYCTPLCQTAVLSCLVGSLLQSLHQSVPMCSVWVLLTLQHGQKNIRPLGAFLNVFILVVLVAFPLHLPPHYFFLLSHTLSDLSA